MFTLKNIWYSPIKNKINKNHILEVRKQGRGRRPARDTFLCVSKESFRSLTSNLLRNTSGLNILPCPGGE